MMNLTEKEVSAEIAIREANPLNRASLNDLAALYIVRDHMDGIQSRYDTGYSREAEPLSPLDTAGEYGRSDFLQAIAGKDLERLWMVIDELMDTLQAVNTKVYNGVMRKINSI